MLAEKKAFDEEIDGNGPFNLECNEEETSGEEVDHYRRMRQELKAHGCLLRARARKNKNETGKENGPMDSCDEESVE